MSESGHLQLVNENFQPLVSGKLPTVTVVPSNHGRWRGDTRLIIHGTLYPVWGWDGEGGGHSPSSSYSLWWIFSLAGSHVLQFFPVSKITDSVNSSIPCEVREEGREGEGVRMYTCRGEAL